MKNQCGFEEYRDPPHTARMQQFVRRLWSSCAAFKRAHTRAGIDLRAAVAEADGMRRRVQALVRTAARMQQHGDEASGRLSATEAALERAVSEEERLRAAVEEEARLRAAAEEEARQLRAAAEEEEVSA